MIPKIVPVKNTILDSTLAHMSYPFKDRTSKKIYHSDDCCSYPAIPFTSTDLFSILRSLMIYLNKKGKDITILDVGCGYGNVLLSSQIIFKNLTSYLENSKPRLNKYNCDFYTLGIEHNSNYIGTASLFGTIFEGDARKLIPEVIKKEKPSIIYFFQISQKPDLCIEMMNSILDNTEKDTFIIYYGPFKRDKEDYKCLIQNNLNLLYKL